MFDRAQSLSVQSQRKAKPLVQQVLWLVLGLMLSLSGFAANAPTQVSQAELSAYKDLQQSKLDALKEAQHKEAEIWKAKAEALDKRIDDQHTNTGQDLERFGILITVLLASIGFFGYFNAVNKAKTEAQDAAKKWYGDNSKTLTEEIAQLRSMVLQIRQEMDAHAKGVKDHADHSKQQIDDIIAEQQRNMWIEKKPQTTAPTEALKLIAERDKELTHKTESSYSFEDWNTRAHAAYAKGDLTAAAYFWQKAATIPGGENHQIAQAFFNIGSTHFLLGQHAKAIATYDELIGRFGEFIEPGLQELVAKALFDKGVCHAGLGQQVEAIVTYEDLLSRFSDQTALVLREQVAKAMNNKGFCQGQLGKKTDAIATYESLVLRFDHAKELVLRESVALALFNKGITLDQLGLGIDAIAAYNDLLVRFGEAPELVLREKVAMAMGKTGVTQLVLGHYPAAIATFDNLVRRFGEAPEFALRENVGMALLNKGTAQNLLGQSKEAFATFDEVLRRFGDAPELVLREKVAMALFNKGGIQGALTKNSEFIITYDELLRRFGDAPEHVLREKVALTLFNKGHLLRQLGQRTEAEATFNELLRRFGHAQEHSLSEPVALGLNSMALMDLIEAKGNWADREAASKLLHQALDRFNHAIAKMGEPWGMALSNRAYVQWLLGNAAKAEEDYAAALRASKDGGLGLYESRLQFFFNPPIPEDKGMRELVDRLWQDFQASNRHQHVYPSMT